MLTDLISQIGLACCSMEPHFFTEELQSLPCKAIWHKRLIYLKCVMSNWTYLIWGWFDSCLRQSQKKCRKPNIIKETTVQWQNAKERLDSSLRKQRNSNIIAADRHWTDCIKIIKSLEHLKCELVKLKPIVLHVD